MQVELTHVISLSCVHAGADLDPLQVLSALSEDLSLASGVQLLSHLICERLHRQRQGTIIRSLHKASHLSASVDRAEVKQIVLLFLFAAVINAIATC